jgi:hypothetical protein
VALPTPAPGLVISYAYLWRNQQRAGQTEGRKDRPCAIVVATRDEDGDTLVYVAPITHIRPTTGAALELPPAVKRRLGLDAAPSWIITDELNRFIWPGYDLRPVSRGRPHVFHWGFLPVDLFDTLKAAVLKHQRDRRLDVVERS